MEPSKPLKGHLPHQLQPSAKRMYRRTSVDIFRGSNKFAFVMDSGRGCSKREIITGFSVTQRRTGETAFSETQYPHPQTLKGESISIREIGQSLEALEASRRGDSRHIRTAPSNELGCPHRRVSNHCNDAMRFVKLTASLGRRD